MCNPMALAIGSFAISAVGALTQHAADQQEYDENEEYREENIVLSNWNARQEYNGSLTQQLQEAEATAATRAEVSREARATAATAQVAAGEAGVSGLSVDALLGDIYGQEARISDRLDQNQEWTAEQLSQERLGIRSKAIDRARSIRKGTPPSLFATGLKIAGAGFGAAGNYRNMTN